MPVTTYNYSLANDFPGGAINVDALQIAIKESTIVTVLQGISVNGDVISITFAAALSGADKTTLDGNQSSPAAGLIASTPTAPFIDATGRFGIIGMLRNANLATTADQPIFVTTNRYILRRVTVGRPSQAILVAAGGIYTGKNKTGSLFVPAAQVYTSLGGQLKYVDTALTSGVTNTVQTKQLIYLSLTLPELVAGTADFCLWGDDYTGLVP